MMIIDDDVHTFFFLPSAGHNSPRTSSRLEFIIQSVDDYSEDRPPPLVWSLDDMIHVEVRVSVSYCVLCYSLLSNVYCLLCTVYCVLCTVYCYTMYCVLCSVYCLLSTVYRVLSTVYCYTMYCVRCTVYCIIPPSVTFHRYLITKKLI